MPRPIKRPRRSTGPATPDEPLSDSGCRPCAREERELSVLIVDDEVALAAVEALCLRRAGMRVDVCTSSLPALKRLSAGERFDVVICDGQMPGLRGVELFQLACIAWPELEQRIIFLSGGLPDQDLRFIQEHALPLLAKPLGGAALEAAIRELVARVGPYVEP